MPLFESFRKLNNIPEPPEPGPEASPLESSSKELELQERDVENTEKLLGGNMGGAIYVKIEKDGGGVFKPHKGFEQEIKDQFVGAERAAYLISRFLGFNFVPPTVIRDVAGETGSPQEFIPDGKTGNELSPGELSRLDRYKLYLFDDLIINGDRHPGNYLVVSEKIIAIDNGQALWSVDSLRNVGLLKYVFNVKVPADIKQSLENFVASLETQNILRDLIAELLGFPVADAFIIRVNAFVECIGRDGKPDRDKFLALLKERIILPHPK